VWGHWQPIHAKHGDGVTCWQLPVGVAKTAWSTNAAMQSQINSDAHTQVYKLLSHEWCTVTKKNVLKTGKDDITKFDPHCIRSADARTKCIFIFKRKLP